ncbi:cytochrome b [Polycladidibacter stylochi]|uniref:cytochrome b n=1 Tax=Polycladidibacter stylochi TaxID=1807766 RepID=UPI00082E14F9|nr:cytochrome b [Pseudovibrio stylochi]
MQAETVKYSRPARAYHWITFILVLVVLPLGFFLGDLPKGQIQGIGYNWHKSIGLLVLVVLLFRLAYRLGHPAPALPASVPKWQVNLSRGIHILLYICLIVQPLIGWFATASFGAPVPFFSLFTIPNFIEKNEALAKQLFQVHSILGWVLVIAISLHILGGLYHWLIAKDGVFQRMTSN